MDFQEFYSVRVTGKIVSEEGQPRVEQLEAVVATVYKKDHPDYDMFKVWPVDHKDPQLPKDHDSKLWFDRNEAEVEVISDENGNPVTDERSTSPTLEQVLLVMTEENALAFVEKELEGRTAWIISRDGAPLDVPCFHAKGTILLTIDDGQVSEVKIIPGTFE